LGGVLPTSQLFDESELDRLLRKWHSGSQKKDTVNRDLYRETFNKLSSGVSEGYSTDYDTRDIEMLLQLKSNIAVFSAFKSHAQSLDYFDALIDQDGKKRSWSNFRKEALKIDANYNQTWLETEYNMAIRQARSAEQWQQFVRDQDVYPNLEYMPSRSANPSELHKRYYGMIKPISDPIWDTLTPPSRWNCKCWLQQSRDAISTGEYTAPEPVKGIEGNSGKSGRIFSADHPYVTRMSSGDKAMIKTEINKLRDEHTELIRVKIDKKNLIVHINADQEDLGPNVDYLQAYIKKQKVDAQINAHSFAPNVKNPEFTVRKVVGDRTQFNGDNIRNYVQNTFSSKLGSKGQLRDQKKAFIALDFLNKLNEDNIEAMAAKLKGSMLISDKLQFVILKNGDKIVELKNSKNIDFAEMLAKLKEELL
jgi:Phage Mu protein F like protein